MLWSQTIEEEDVSTRKSSKTPWYIVIIKSLTGKSDSASTNTSRRSAYGRETLLLASNKKLLIFHLLVRCKIK